MQRHTFCSMKFLCEQRYELVRCTYLHARIPPLWNLNFSNSFCCHLPSHSLGSSNSFRGPTYSIQFSMVCRNLCDRFYSKIIFGKSHYEGGKKYCRRCEVHYCHNRASCPCCGMALSGSLSPPFTAFHHPHSFLCVFSNCQNNG